MKRSMLNLSLVVGLLGAGLVSLPVEANAAESAPVVAQAKTSPLKGSKTRALVKVGNRSYFQIPVQGGDQKNLSFRFQGRPLSGISIENGYLVVNLPETQDPGVHRVTVRIRSGHEVAYSSFILDIHRKEDFIPVK